MEEEPKEKPQTTTHPPGTTFLSSRCIPTGSPTMGDQRSLRCHGKGHKRVWPLGRKCSSNYMWSNTCCHIRAEMGGPPTQVNGNGEGRSRRRRKPAKISPSWLRHCNSVQRGTRLNRIKQGGRLQTHIRPSPRMQPRNTSTTHRQSTVGLLPQPFYRRV